MRSVLAVVFVAAIGCVVDVDADDAASGFDAADEPRPGGDEELLGPPGPERHCNEHLEQVACLEAGCRWQELYGVALDDDTCEVGPPWALCYPSTLGQPCDDEALRCDDGLYAWVLPGPDDAVVITRSPTSCGMPEHFLPCPTPSIDEQLVASPEQVDPDAVPPADVDGLLARACACGCDGPA